MRTSRTVAALNSLFNVFGSAINAAGAVRGHHAPKGLRRLGIDPVEFAKIRRS